MSKKVEKYKGWSLKPGVLKIGNPPLKAWWVSHDSNPTMGKWCISVIEARKFIDNAEAKVNSEIKKTTK